MNEPSTYFIRREIPEPEYAELPVSAMEDEPSIGDYWRAVARHKRLILGLVLVALLSAGPVAYLIAPSYVATSTILIDHRAPKIDIKPGAPDAQTLSDEEADTYYATQNKVLESRSLALRVIQDLGLEDSPILKRQSLLARFSIKGRAPNSAEIREKEIDS